MAKHSRRTTGLLTYLRTFEPARLRAAYVGTVLFLRTLGYTLPARVDGKVTGILAALAVIVPLVQGELTRAGVFPLGAVAAAVDDTGLVVAGPAAPQADGTEVYVTAVAGGSQPTDPGRPALDVDPSTAGQLEPATPELIETADVPPSPLSIEEQDAAGGDHEPAA